MSTNNQTSLAGSNSFGMLTFTVNNRPFGINVFKLREIVNVGKVTDIPGKHPHISGLIVVRNESMPLIDLGKALRHPAQSGRMALITECNGTVQALQVDSVEQIHHVDWADVKKPNTGTNLLTAAVTIENRIIGILDIENILSSIYGDSDIESEAVKSEAGIGHRVMIVDDSGVARNQVVRCTVPLGFEIDQFKNGQEALMHLESLVEQGVSPNEQYALIISDIEMPAMDGYTLTSKIKQNPQMQETKVLLHSSLSGAFNQSMVSNVGADAFISKFDTKTIQQQILMLTGQSDKQAA